MAGGKTVERENIFPEGMPKRIVKGHVLYTPVVTVVPGKLVFVSGILSRNAKGEIVGKGDMAAQIRQVFENIKTALAAAGATMDDVVKRQTFTTDIDAYFENIEAAWSTAATTVPPAPPSRCAGCRIRIFSSRSK